MSSQHSSNVALPAFVPDADSVNNVNDKGIVGGGVVDSPPADAIDVAGLFAQAVEVAQAADHFEEIVAHDDLQAFADRAIAARESLESVILAGLESRVLPAAAGGNRHAIVHEFRGGAMHDDFSVVFLLLGGDDRERREELRRFGFEPMIVTLARKLRPFKLHHRWDKETNANALVAAW